MKTVGRCQGKDYRAARMMGCKIRQNRTAFTMLKEHINDIRIRWSPKERRGSRYDPVIFLETPEQARKLIRHLREQLRNAHRERNQELIVELEDIMSTVEYLSRKFFRWEQSISQSLRNEDLREIKKLPLNL